MDVGQIVGRKIKEYRKKAGKTQLSFSLSTYMSPSYISRFERGIVTNPTKATLEHIARSLGITLEELIHDETQPPVTASCPPQTTAAANELDYDDYRALRARYDRLPPWRQRQIRLILETLLEEEN